jgi:hypothetical protein
MTRFAEMSAIMAAISYLLSSNTALIASFLVFTNQAHRHHSLSGKRPLLIHMEMVVVDDCMFSSRHIMIHKHELERLC